MAIDAIFQIYINQNTNTSECFQKYSLIHLCLECITHVLIEDTTCMLELKLSEMARCGALGWSLLVDLCDQGRCDLAY